MNRHLLSKLAYSTLTFAALAFASGSAWAQHGGGGHGGGGHGGGGGGHGGGGHGGGGAAHFSSGGGGAHFSGSSGHLSGGAAQFSGSRAFSTSPATRNWSGNNWNRGGYNTWGHNGYGGYGYRHGFYGGFYGGFPWYWGWGGYYPYYGGGYYPYYDSGYNSYYPDYSDSGYNYAPDYSYSAPSYPSTPVGDVNTTTSPETPPQQPSAIADNAVLIGVRVPENAEIWIDGAKTAQTGRFREFVTPSLEPGQKFNYDIKARWTENGQEVIRDRQVGFYAGDRLMVNLLASPKQRSKQVQSAPVP